MPSHKCAYFRCSNTSDATSMFRFPWNDQNRLEIWLNNCGNMTITHLPKENFRSRYICMDHFEKKYLRDGTEHRKRLRKMAIPIHYQDKEQHPTPEDSHTNTLPPSSPDLKVLTPKRVYTNKRKRLSFVTEEETEDEATYCMTKRAKLTDTPKCQNLKKKLIDSNKKLKLEKTKNKILRNKVIAKKHATDITKHNFKSKSSKLLTKMQLRKSKQQWTNAEKKFCMSLYYKSPTAYKFMLNSGIILAAPSTIQRWLQETNCLPGINEEVMDNIKNKFSDKSTKERACVVCFDEMSIMVNLEYSNKYDLIEGYEDFGDGDRSQKEAKYALVFIARGIYTNWKIPLAYFLSSKSVDSEKLQLIVDSVITKLFDCGLLPKVTVCDQASTNVKLIKCLGATVDYPFYFINGHKIYAIFDAPHLIKNIRSNLINNDFDLNGNRISFKDIIHVYDLDKKNKSKSLPKLTPVHINPNSFQKMKVKLATQVLSNSVAGAIKTAIDCGEIATDSATHTADFVRLCNDLFDCLNSKNKFDCNPYRCAVTANQNTSVNKMLISGKEAFSKLKKISYNKNNELRMTRPPCFDGMIQTINAINQLSAEEISPGTGVKFIITYRLNQDVIENLFGIYRIKGGCNKNPTSKLLRSMFRSNLLNNLMKFDQTNCESDQTIFLSTQHNAQPSRPKPTSSSTSNVSCTLDVDEDVGGASRSNVTSPREESTTNSSLEEVTLEKCSVVYFAGWLGKMCIDKFNCSDCKQMLLKNEVDLTDKTQLLLINKTYSNILTPTLKSPTDYLFQLVNQILDYFKQHLDDLYKNNLVADLLVDFKSGLNVLVDDYHDLNHFDYLIKKLIEVKIHDYCKGRKKSLQSAPKLRILQNK